MAFVSIGRLIEDDDTLATRDRCDRQNRQYGR